MNCCPDEPQARPLAVVFVLVLILTCVPPLYAFGTGAVSGVVTDSHGDPVVGAAVMVAGTAFGAMTNSRGEYYIPQLSAGEY